MHKHFDGTPEVNLERMLRHRRAMITALKAKHPESAPAEVMAQRLCARGSLL